MQVFNQIDSFYLIIHRSLGVKFDRSLNGIYSHKWKYRSLIIYDVPSMMQEDVQALLRTNAYIKTLHRFYVFLTGKPKENELVISQYFDYVAESYEQLIETQQNLTNIQFQLQYILSKINIKKPKILDFGCGTGVSAIVTKAFESQYGEIEIIGYDISSAMLEKSKKAGLKTLNHRSLLKLKDHSLDGIFASYSLHFLTDVNILSLIWQKLKLNGIFTANFHKNINLDEVVSFVKLKGGSITLIGEVGKSQIYAFSKSDFPFIKKDLLKNHLKKHQIAVNVEDLVDTLIKFSILPTYEYDGKLYLLLGDVENLIGFLKSLTFADWVYGGVELYEQTFKIVSPVVEFNFRTDEKATLTPFNIALLSNLLQETKYAKPNGISIKSKFNEICEVITKSKYLSDYLNLKRRNNLKVEESRVTNFSNSASYMGSKKVLRSFLIEGLSGAINQNAIVLDVMCGSGAFAGAAAMSNRVFVSDAMKFCRTLAMVQGAGYNVERASLVISEINRLSKINIEELKEIFVDGLLEENKFFHSEIDQKFVDEYSNFCIKYSFSNLLFSDLYNSSINNSNNTSYFLLTCAYSNLYFGLRQGIELDSLRFAIDRLENLEDRIWALGTLISTLSAIANTYGGHFAQPKFKNLKSLPISEIYSLIEQRTISISNEFFARSLSFASESETHTGYKIEQIPGPWEVALDQFHKFEGEKVVYVDAPYTRDEYSRYYHVLETLVDYNYVPLSGIGRMPNKGNGARFTTEFFTKSEDKFKSKYIYLISSILKNGMTCAWSYSNSASASIVEIIYEICLNFSCEIRSYQTPYIYKAQGGKKSKKIKEYFVIIQPVL